jgi:hypothetical protein
MTAGRRELSYLWVIGQFIQNSTHHYTKLNSSQTVVSEVFIYQTKCRKATLSHTSKRDNPACTHAHTHTQMHMWT